MSWPDVADVVGTALSVLDNVVALLSARVVAEMADARVSRYDIGDFTVPRRAAGMPLLVLIAGCLLCYARLRGTRRL